MLNKISQVFLVVLFVFCGFFFLVQDKAIAEMSMVQNYQLHADHTQDTDTTKNQEVVVELKTEPEYIKERQPAKIVFSFKDPKGKPVEDLSITHDRILHVIIICQDFSVFAHIHPEDFGAITRGMKRTAQFPVQYTFPKAGLYLVRVDFAVKGELHSKQFTLDVRGEPFMTFLKKDLSRNKRFGDYDVNLSTGPEDVATGEQVTLNYLFSKDGAPVTDLEPYLSAPMHVAIISADRNYFIDAYGEVPGSVAGGHLEHHMHSPIPDKFGPKVEVHTIFPSKGLYYIFGEIKHEGKIVVSLFMIEVK
ncbi:MAG: hypothetical protein ACLPX5_07105 [Dissulfurispiraceae bacterium]